MSINIAPNAKVAYKRSTLALMVLCVKGWKALGSVKKKKVS